MKWAVERSWARKFAGSFCEVAGVWTVVKYEGRPESKDRLRIALAQVNTPRRFKVSRPQSSIGFVPSKFSTDFII
jgi:hypothetical protein